MLRPHPVIVACAFCLAACRSESDTSPAIHTPEVIDQRIELSLAVHEPDVVTPIGLAIDDQDRLFVLESHTHTPPDNYAGPDSDRVKMFIDRDEDGVLEFIGIYADEIIDGMNVAFGSDGHLYVVTSQSVLRLPDRDGDGVNDGSEIVLEMVEPESVYDHAGLLGITATSDGWLYISRGNTGSKGWKIVGTDGQSIGGYGDGGNILRCRLDGSSLEEVATGFWNPFDLAFDASGRLFAIDNDPDSQGPNRLVDVVKGGDFGYKSLYGGSGIHPYVAWNGELAGTLPYAVGLGEAPSGMLDASRTSFPQDYASSFLVSIWEESKIVRVQLREEQGMLSGEVFDVLQGEADFRPVAFAADSKGSVYFTDWVVRTYPNHGKGRIWKLVNTDRSTAMSPRSPFEMADPDSYLVERTAIAGIHDIKDIERLKNALLSEDPHLRTVARETLRQPIFHSWLRQAVMDVNPELRIQAALVLETLETPDRLAILARLLTDQDEAVRKVALLWAGRSGSTDLLVKVRSMLREGYITPALFDVYVSTIGHLQPEFQAAYLAREEEFSRALERPVPEGYFLDILNNATLPGSLRARVLPYLSDEELDVDKLREGVYEGSEVLRDASLFALLYSKKDAAAEVLLDMVSDTRMDPEVRADALFALTYHLDRREEKDDLKGRVARVIDAVDPADGANGPILIEAMRLSRAMRDTTLGFDVPSTSSLSPALQDQFDHLAGAYSYPDTEAAWISALEGGGDSRRGRRVFFSKQAQCSTCHTVSDRGGAIGPDLTNVAASKSMQQIVRSILYPSEEIAPEWQGWYVRTADGESHFGRQIDVGYSSVELMDLDGSFKQYDDVEEYGISSLSLMPEGLYYQMTLTDMRDLVAFLSAPAIE